MQITDDEKQRINRIIHKTKHIKSIDPEYKVFGAKKWEYEWPKPVSESKLTAFENKHGILLPREYRLFMSFVANGGPGFAYGIYPLEETKQFGDIEKECTCFPFMAYEDFKVIEDRQREIYEVDENSNEDLFYDGLLTIATEGCTFDICLVVTGKYRGRLVRTDLNEEGPFCFIYDRNFLDWYERWLDDFIAGMEMGRFGGSVPGSQPELRRQFVSEANTEIKTSILNSLGRFPNIDDETMALWESACKTEASPGLTYVALQQLLNSKAPIAPAVMQFLFNSPPEKRNECIRLLRFASRHGVDIEPFIPKLLVIMGTLPLDSFLDDVFSNAVWAVQETSYNKYETFLPFLELPDQRIKWTVFWALEISGDRNTEDFVNRLLPYFQDEDIEMVRRVILSLMEIRDDRIPALVDKAYERFPEFETLRKNYYRRTWG